MAAAQHNGERRFRAFARPQGYPDLRLPGGVVEIHERPAHGPQKLRVLGRAEAEQLHAELGAALRAFDLARDIARDVAAEIGDRPRAYTGPDPIRGQTLADVDAIERGEAA